MTVFDPSVFGFCEQFQTGYVPNTPILSTFPNSGLATPRYRASALKYG
ncbi:hypothetical protein GS682_16905 [Nostoc sp. B(2019)]|nr:hypothetical protein [Nostoc sp. B(2019)]